jgi:DNA-binding cell septation regulator SpoVG
MRISDIRITLVDKEGPVRAYVDFIIEEAMLVHDARIIQIHNPQRLLVAMPSSRRTKHCPGCNAKMFSDSKFCPMCAILQAPHDSRGPKHKDIIHPIHNTFRSKLEELILTRYKEVVAEAAITSRQMLEANRAAKRG